MLTTQLRDGVLGPESSIAKLFWASWHQRLGELAMDVLGTEATALGAGPPQTRLRHGFLNSRAETIYGGSHEIQRNIVGERVLGLPRGPR